MSLKKVFGGILVVAVLVLGALVFLKKESPEKVLTDQAVQNGQGTEVVPSGEMEKKEMPPVAGGEQIPTEYVRLVSNLTRVAVFAFDVEVDRSTLGPSSIRYCVMKESEKDDPLRTCVGHTTKAEGFSLFYDDQSRILTVRDDREGLATGTGRFNTGCLDCVSVVEFHDLRTKSGAPLPPKRVVVF